MKSWLALISLVLALAGSTEASAAKRAMTLADVHRLRDVAEPALSPDGKWLLYSVTSDDLAWDKQVSEVWRVDSHGGAERRLTYASPKSSSWAAQYSPDGHWIAF